MKKIALDGDFNFSDEQLNRLKAAGQIEKIDSVTTDEEWLKKVKGYDVICTWGDHVLANLDKLENVLVTYPYTSLKVYIDTETSRISQIEGTTGDQTTKYVYDYKTPVNITPPANAKSATTQ